MGCCPPDCQNQVQKINTTSRFSSCCSCVSPKIPGAKLTTTINEPTAMAPPLTLSIIFAFCLIPLSYSLPFIVLHGTFLYLSLIFVWCCSSPLISFFSHHMVGFVYLERFKCGFSFSFPFFYFLFLASSKILLFLCYTFFCAWHWQASVINALTEESHSSRSYWAVGLVLKDIACMLASPFTFRVLLLLIYRIKASNLVLTSG